MTDQIKVSVEVDKLKAEQSLRDLSRQLNAADNLINQMRRSGIEWASDFKSATEKVRTEVSKLGTIASNSTNDMIKGNKNFNQSIDNVISKVSKLQQSLTDVGKNFRLPLNASKLPVTAPLRDDNEKRRSEYFTKLQAAYQKEQSALRQHNEKIESLRKQRLAQEQLQYKNREKAREAFAREEKATSLGIKVADLDKYNQALRRKQEADSRATQSGKQLDDTTKRLGLAATLQAGNVNKLSAAWALAKQRMKESISVANTFQTAARGVTAVFGSLLFKVAEFVKTAPSLSSDMLGYRNALQLVTGSQKEAAGLLGTAIEIATRLKLSITSVTKEYSKFTNSATIAGLSVERATRTFENFSIAARVLNLSQQRTSGMFLALEQMISKGRVSMEELRRQLGEHIPGALNLAAEAMGYSKEELGKFIREVSNGKVVSLELVENLGKLVRDRTIKLLPASLEKWSAAVQNLVNAFDMLRLRLGTVISNMFGSWVDGLGNAIRAFNNWMGPIEVLQGTVTELSDELKSVTIAANENHSTMLKLIDGETNLAEITSSTTKNIYDMEKGMTAMNLAGIGLIGTVGTAGLGGAFAFLGKSIGWIKSGLKNFAAPFALAISKVKPLLALLGAGGLLKIIFELRLALQALALTIQAVAYRFAALALLNPFVAFPALIAAATAALYFYLDGNDELEEKQKKINESFVEAQEKTKAFNTELEGIMTTMADLGQVEIAVEAANLKVVNDELEKERQQLNEKVRLSKEQIGWLDEQLKKVGYITDDVEKYNEVYDEVTFKLKRVNGELDASIPRIHAMKTATVLLKQQFEDVGNIIKQQIANNEIDELKIKVGMVGREDVDRDLALLDQKFRDLKNKAIIKVGLENVKEATAATDLLDQQYKLEKQLLLTTNAYKKQQNAVRDFETASKSLSDTLASSITNLEQQSMTFGKSGYELDQLNTQFKIAELNEKALALEATATTKAMRDQVAAIRENINTVAALSQNLNLLKEQERMRAERVKMGHEATKKQLDLMKKGHELLGKTLTLEQQYVLRLDEIRPALEAVGATQEQVSAVMRNEWRQIVDNADNGLRSMEAVTEEFAKGMQENFSNFFFDIMEGDFDNLADSFTSMLNRMVAEAIATNLTKYLLGPGGGGGIFQSILGSPVVSSLFNVAPAVPSLIGGGGAGILQTSGGFNVNLPGNAYGGNYTVGGTGGTDSQVVAFKATPGESIQVTPPSKKADVHNGMSGNTIINFNVTTPDIGSFNSSQSQMEVQLRELVQRAGRNL